MRRWIGGRSRCSVASPVMAPGCRRPTSSRPTARMSSRVELPGVRREDVDVNLNGNQLVVTGEVKERKREGLFRRRTRRVGEFELRVTLPGYLRDGDIEASLAHGVLTVYVPKAESTKSSKITVSESGDGSP